MTAWHMTDWLWASKQTTRDKLSKKFKFEYNEATISGREKGLERFRLRSARPFESFIFAVSWRTPQSTCVLKSNGPGHPGRD